VLIEPAVPATERIGIDEGEWRVDPAALADWEAWIRTIEPLEYTPEEAASMAEFDERMRAALSARSPGTALRDGRGEAISLPDASADAVFVSSAWHWMDAGRALAEVPASRVGDGALRRRAAAKRERPCL